MRNKKYITIYHGSDHVIKNPKYNDGRENNDYGKGFYTTADKEKANEWAVLNGQDTAITNTYKIDMSDLNVLNLDDYGPLAWISEIIAHRGTRGEAQQKLGSLLIEKYKINTDNADIIIGYRADDSYIDIVDSFLKNEFSLEEVSNLFKKGHLGTQIFIKSEKAFNSLKYLRSENVIEIDFYGKRDTAARKDVTRFLNNRQTQILLDGYVPSGILARDAIKYNCVYDKENGYTYIYKKQPSITQNNSKIINRFKEEIGDD